MLDVSGSMVGTKLELLKQAMGFAIDNLGPRDRLCVVSFSSGANRLIRLEYRLRRPASSSCDRPTRLCPNNRLRPERASESQKQRNSSGDLLG
jgi:16S rRNA C1402 N4-methylase RsmH